VPGKRLLVESRDALSIIERGALRASVGSTNVASVRRLPLHKMLQDTKLRQIEADRRKYAWQLALGRIGFLKLVPFVDPTDARTARQGDNESAPLISAHAASWAENAAGW
jgi:hypothetical protein